MNITKKIRVFAVVCLSCLATSAVYANSTPTSFYPYLYFGGEVGWANSNWSDFTNINADNTGTAYGGKIGYQASRRFGVEGGGFVLPKSNQNEDGLTGSVQSWVAYGAATFRFPLKSEALYLRGKLGAAYRNLDHDGNLYTGVGTGDYVTAILGASLNYAFATKTPLIVGIEYSNIFGSSDSWSSHGSINDNAAPSVQIVTATLSVALTV